VATYSGLILNGGFETGDFFGWTLNGQGGGYDLVDTFYQSTEGIEPHSGSYFARLGQYGTPGYLSQTLATTAGARYRLSFWLNSPDGQTPNLFLVSWGGNMIFSRTNLPALGWTNLQFVLTASATNTILQFGFQDDPTALGLDDISVVQIGPGITQQPQSRTVACQSNAIFTVTANGPLPLSYQWRLNGSPLPGATNTAYSVTPLTCQSPASYSVVVTNSSGAVTSAVATLTVADPDPPMITCPTNLLVNSDPGQCSAAVSYVVTATDNCAVVSLVVTPPSGAVFPKGTNIVTCVASDCGGNTNTCSFTVTVLDREPPVILCPINQTLVCNTTNGAQAFFAPTATDNCDGVVPVVCTPSSGSFFPLGTNTVACVATDTSGNTNTCVFSVTVMESPPQLSINQSGTNLTLSWPQSCLNYAVEQKASLDPTAPWAPLGITPTPAGNSYQVMLKTGNGTQFFRLNSAR
jgi:hypothetical protein